MTIENCALNKPQEGDPTDNISSPLIHHVMDSMGKQPPMQMADAAADLVGSSVKITPESRHRAATPEILKMNPADRAAAVQS